jgi:hypothetical protein
MSDATQTDQRELTTETSQRPRMAVRLPKAAGRPHQGLHFHAFPDTPHSLRLLGEAAMTEGHQKEQISCAAACEEDSAPTTVRAARQLTNPAAISLPRASARIPPAFPPPRSRTPAPPRPSAADQMPAVPRPINQLSPSLRTVRCRSPPSFRGPQRRSAPRFHFPFPGAIAIPRIAQTLKLNTRLLSEPPRWRGRPSRPGLCGRSLRREPGRRAELSAETAIRPTNRQSRPARP